MDSFGFIGTGNMGGALARAVSKTVPGTQQMLADFFADKAQALARELGCIACDNETLAGSCKYIVLGVKPQMLEGLFAELSSLLQARRDEFVLVSMAAGVPIRRIQELAGKDYPVIRIMPNTPCSIGKGMVLCCRSDNVTEAQYSVFLEAFSQAGSLLSIPESLIDAGCAISGCGPAYVYTFIEALSDAGVALGLTRNDARLLAVQTVLGSAELVKESGQHPAQLRDAVCSPGGSTIQGVLALERGGFRAAVADCVEAAYDKTVALGK